KMVKIAVVGSNEFVVGFQLAGIKDTIELNDNYFSQLKNFKTKKEIGIVVVDEKVMGNLEPHQRFEIEASVEPVFIPVSTTAEQDSLKKLIKKSIGVDLWK
ncbi:V-type ATP synthase subunit F, partial [Candidatus Woesearchaeota archaeon]|nr:V-type ATP synthase subunit F [Candidatus Woesearchaeota archaeon]